MHRRRSGRRDVTPDLRSYTGGARQPLYIANDTTVTRKSVVVYSTPMTRNGPRLPGTGRSRWTTNHLVTQQKIRNNRTYPDLWVGNPLVAGSSPPAPRQRRPENLSAPSTPSKPTAGLVASTLGASDIECSRLWSPARRTADYPACVQTFRVTAPSCTIILSRFPTPQCSVILPSTTFMTSTVSNSTILPVGATPRMGPVWVP